MMINTSQGIKLWHMLAQKGALSLELKGLKHSRGSVYAHIKRTYGLRGSRQSVYEQFCRLIEEEQDNGSANQQGQG